MGDQTAEKTSKVKVSIYLEPRVAKLLRHRAAGTFKSMSSIVEDLITKDIKPWRKKEEQLQ